MDENKLRALLTAVQCGSITKAAAQLDYTQSGMTHMMNKLETELGCRLLERTSHGVKLTVQGEHLMPYVHNVLRACDVLRREADECSNLQGQCLRVGCFPSIARSWLPDVLQRFRKMHPEVRVDVLVRGNELVEALEEDKIQLCAGGQPLRPRLRVDAAAACAAAGGRAARLSVGGEDRSACASVGGDVHLRRRAGCRAVPPP